MRTPDFNQLCKVFDRQVPDRVTLFEFALNGPLCERLTKRGSPENDDTAQKAKWWIDAYRDAGYDYAFIYPNLFYYPKQTPKKAASISLNEGAMIRDRKSFESYPWPDPDQLDYSLFDELNDALPRGMKLIVQGPGGVQENVINLVGFDNLCFMLYEDPELAGDIFEAVGSRMVSYFSHVCHYDSVGAIFSCDDWGHKNQTMFSPKIMRQHLFPWHRQIVASVHRYEKPVILHSCGNLHEVMDDIIAMGYDAKHSFEDVIQPVEEAYEQYCDRIAILGGIDVNFLCNSTVDDIRKRCLAMIGRTGSRGGYALGSGNSIPSYVPDENYLAMIETAINFNKER